MGDQHGHTRVTVCGQGAAAVETKPTDPQHARAHNGQRHVMRWHGLGWETLAITQHHGSNQRSDTGGDVHDDAASKVHDPQITQPTAAPDPVADRSVNQDQPSGRKEYDSRKAHTFSKATDDQGRCNDSKCHLKQCKHALRNRTGFRIFANLRQQHVIQATDKGV